MPAGSSSNGVGPYVDYPPEDEGDIHPCRRRSSFDRPWPDAATDFALYCLGVIQQKGSAISLPTFATADQVCGGTGGSTSVDNRRPRDLFTAQQCTCGKEGAAGRGHP